MKVRQVRYVLWGRWLAGVITLMSVVAMAGEPSKVQDQDVLFTIQGSNTVGAHLAPQMVEAYLRHKGATDVQTHNISTQNEVMVEGFLSDQTKTLRIKIAAHGSSTGFKGLQAGTADLAASSRPIKQKEVDALAYLGNMRSIDSEHILGIDGLAIIVHPSNPITKLDKATIARLFSGDIKNWKEIGGFDREVHIHARDSQSGTWDTFKSLVLGKSFSLTKDAMRYESNDELSNMVSADPGAIGFTGVASINQSKVLAVSDGESRALLPTELNIATEDYTLARRLYFYSPGSLVKPVVREFIQFALNGEGQRIVSDVGFVSQNIQAVTADFDTSVPDSFKRLVEGYKRLSVNFRFAEGRKRLDNKAERDVDRLRDYIEGQGMAPEQLLLIGYADRQSNELRAQLISEYRALSVKKALNRENPIVKFYTGYGQYMPLAGESGELGVSKNGRVEVWAR